MRESCWVRLDILGTKPDDDPGPIEVGIGHDPVWITPDDAREFAAALLRAADLAAPQNGGEAKP